MSSTVGHALCGISCLMLARGVKGESQAFNEKWWIAVFAVVACLPDFDFIVGYIVAGDFHRYHSGASHSLIVVLIASLVLSALLAAAKRRNLFPWIFTAILSHVIIDLFTGPRLGLHQSYGVCLFWPFHEARIRMPISLFLGVEHATVDALVGWHNVKVIAVEVFMFAPLLIFLKKLFRKRITAVAAVKERSI